MYTIDTSSIIHFNQTLWALALGAMKLDPAAIQAIRAPGTNLLTVTVLLLAGISEELGQSVVLLANRVKPGRFVMSLLLNGLIFMLGVCMIGGTTWLTAKVLFHSQVPFIGVLRAVGLSYAPLLLSFLVLLPYMGTFINRTLSVWSFLALLVALMATMELVLWQALVCALIGWLLVQLLKYTLGWPVVVFERWLRSTTAGASLKVGPQDLVKTITEHTIDNPKGGKL